MEAGNMRAVGDRIEALLEELGAVADPRARARAEELVRSLMELYGAGLGRILEIAGQAGAEGGPLGPRVAEDPLVASLLLLHGLHPDSAETRIQRALDRVRPYLASHGGDVSFLGLSEGVAHLRLEGSCHGCGSSTVTMKLAIEQAVEEAAPEVERLDVEGVAPLAASPLIQIQVAGSRPRAAGGPPPADWIAVGERPGLDDAGLAALELGGQKVVLCRSGESLYAYRDRCPACGSALGASTLTEAVLACPACEQRYDVRRAGRSLNGGGDLEPLPLLQEKGAIRVAVPAAS